MCNISEACPICANTTTKPYYQVKDYAVTKELFSLVKCSNCSLVYTNPQPTNQNMPRYYQSSSYISHSQYSSNLTERVYYLARYFMLRQKLKWVHKSLGSKGRVLDYGSGTGSFVTLLHKNKWDAWGVEPNDQARSIANLNGSTRVVDSLDTLPQGQYDAITLWHVLEHIPNLEHMINELLARLSTTGFLFVAVPNCASYDAQYYKEYWAGFDVPRHLFHFTPDSMKLLVKKHRLDLIKLIPLKLDAYYICMKSEKYRNGSILKAIFQATKSNILAKRNNLNYSSLVYVLRK